MNIHDKQIGGDHYQLPIQPWSIIESNQLDFWEGNIIKYILRYRRKWPNDPAKQAEDLKKCRHYLEYLLGRLDVEN